MIVIADASPLVTLTICDSLDILDKLFNNVKVSQAVYEEVTVGGKLGSDKLKEYLQGKVIDLDLSSFVIEGNSLDKGELSSIALYKHLQADYLLIDEKAGRKVAKLNNIKVIGSLGVLIEAKKKGILKSIKPHIKILKLSQIYFNPNLLDYALKMVNEYE
jgi:predicted nucleic acid-binding protein